MLKNKSSKQNKIVTFVGIEFIVFLICIFFLKDMNVLFCILQEWAKFTFYDNRQYFNDFITVSLLTLITLLDVYVYHIVTNDRMVCIILNLNRKSKKCILGMYRKGTNIQQAPVFRHLRALRKSPWKFIIWMNEIIITLHVAGFLHPAIFWYFHHSSDKSGLKVADCTAQSAGYWCPYGTLCC